MTDDIILNYISLEDLTDHEIEEKIILIRERRLMARRVYEETQRLKREKELGKLIIGLDKQLGMFVKEMASADKAIAKVEKRAIHVRALRLEIGDMSALVEPKGDK